MTELEKPASAVVISATFTAEPLLPYLRLVLREAGLALDVRCTAYNQIFQELLSPSSSLAANKSGVNVVLIRVEDFVREIEDVEEALILVKRTASELKNAFTQYAQRAKIPTVVAVMPPLPTLAKALLAGIGDAYAKLRAHISLLPGITFLACGGLESDSAQEGYDALTDELAHIPFSEEQYASIALAIARKVHTLRVPAYKVLALDCDETLWRGVVGEDGVAGLTISAGLACVQRFAVEKQRQGVLVCLVSKNVERDVLEVFKKRSDMILKIEHVVAHRVNWDSKPSNIASLARALNLGLDAFVFIDDNPIECAQMRAELPQVVTLQLPSEDEIEIFLANLWTFDKVTVTEEDARRTSMYRENAAREELEKSTTDIGEFIASLGLKIEITPPEESEWARIAQLTQRTNQFNFTTRRYTEAEIRSLSVEGSCVLCVKVRDRFGDYGMVGVVIACEMPGRLVVDTLLLSCRVLGRGVEHTIVRHLGGIAKERNLQHLDLIYIATAKNEPAHAFIESLAASFCVAGQDRSVYEVPTEVACAVAHKPGHDPAVINEVRPRNDHASTNSIVGIPRSERYEKLARVLTTGSAVLETARRSNVRKRSLPGRAERPASDTEGKLLFLWQEALQMEGLGVEDDYFALGGTSLLAARLIAEISRRFDITLPMTIILEASTVRALARLLEHPSGVRTENLIELKRGGPRKLFLVHDGDGETLLYLNLANRITGDIAVFGIQPRAIARVPLAHDTIEAMAAFYIELIRKKQPDGPYLLGGMCAGGVIAYEMATQLAQAGERVELVALLDAARPGARKKKGRIRKQRLERIRQAVVAGQSGSTLERAGLTIRTFAQKSFCALRWEIAHRGVRLSTRVRFYLLSELLRRGRAWPRLVPELSVRQIYDSAETHYTPRPLSTVVVVLAEATEGKGDDTPYREIYADEGLGWESVAGGLKILDVEGGHSSMLQEQFVDSLAAALMPYLQMRIEPVRTIR